MQRRQLHHLQPVSLCPVCIWVLPQRGELLLLLFSAPRLSLLQRDGVSELQDRPLPLIGFLPSLPGLQLRDLQQLALFPVSSLQLWIFPVRWKLSRL